MTDLEDLSAPITVEARPDGIAISRGEGHTIHLQPHDDRTALTAEVECWVCRGTGCYYGNGEPCETCATRGTILVQQVPRPSPTEPVCFDGEAPVDEVSDHWEGTLPQPDEDDCCLPEGLTAETQRLEEAVAYGRRTSRTFVAMRVDDVAALLAAAERLPEAEAERARLEQVAERTGTRWCLCSMADRMNDRAQPHCPIHGEPRYWQQRAEAAERDLAEARAALARVEALHTPWATADGQHTCCDHDEQTWPCETIRAALARVEQELAQVEHADDPHCGVCRAQGFVRAALAGAAETALIGEEGELS